LQPIGGGEELTAAVPRTVGISRVQSTLFLTRFQKSKEPFRVMAATVVPYFPYRAARRVGGRAPISGAGTGALWGVDLGIGTRSRLLHSVGGGVGDEKKTKKRSGT
jgi:hypothetical protein